MSTNKENDQKKKNQHNESDSMKRIFNQMMKGMGKCCSEMEKNGNGSRVMKEMMESCCDTKTDKSQTDDTASPKSE